MIPFAPRLIPVILPNLAHHVEQIRNAALRTDQLLFNAIQNQPSPPEPTPTPTPSSASARQSGPSPPLVHPPPNRSSTQATEASVESISSLATFGTDKAPPSRHRAATVPDSQGAGGIPASVNTIVTVSEVSPAPSRPQSPAGRSVHSPVQPSSTSGVNNAAPSPSVFPEDIDLFDYQATVTNLTVQFLSEHEQTRVAALKWLIMLHQKAPKKVYIHVFKLGKHVHMISTFLLVVYHQILAMDDGTFPALLKTLSDSSEEVHIQTVIFNTHN